MPRFANNASSWALDNPRSIKTKIMCAPTMNAAAINVQLAAAKLVSNWCQRGHAKCWLRLLLHVLPTKQKVFEVEPRGFEPLTFAVQRRTAMFQPALLCGLFARFLTFSKGSLSYCVLA